MMKDKLNKIFLVDKAKTALLIIGLVILILGLMCLPASFGNSPPRNLSLFNNLADSGMFLRIGVILMLAGGIIIMISLFMPNMEKKK